MSTRPTLLQQTSTASHVHLAIVLKLTVMKSWPTQLASSAQPIIIVTDITRANIVIHARPSVPNTAARPMTAPLHLTANVFVMKAATGTLLIRLIISGSVSLTLHVRREQVFCIKVSCHVIFQCMNSKTTDKVISGLSVLLTRLILFSLYLIFVCLDWFILSYYLFYCIFSWIMR